MAMAKKAEAPSVAPVTFAGLGDVDAFVLARLGAIDPDRLQSISRAIFAAAEYNGSAFEIPADQAANFLA